MKTLFIQTHELARALSELPTQYLCNIALRFICAKHEFDLDDAHVSNEENFCLLDSVKLMTMALLKEQKEYRLWDTQSKAFYHGLGDVFDMDRSSSDTYKKDCHNIRQRLIDSLLTRPDRTLCVLIPE